MGINTYLLLLQDIAKVLDETDETLHHMVDPADLLGWEHVNK